MTAQGSVLGDGELHYNHVSTVPGIHKKRMQKSANKTPGAGLWLQIPDMIKIREPNLQTFGQEITQKIETMSGKVHTGTMVLRSLGTALKG
jgi:hypothetical protein